MDWAALKQSFQKYRYVMLTALLGILLMILPEYTHDKQEREAVPDVSVPSLETSLEELLSQVSGAGKVEVLITQKEGPKTVYQIDGETRDDVSRQDTVLITDAQRNEMGLIQQVEAPVYRGAVILCQGADQPKVKLAVVEAVCCATGLASNQIAVLKMR